MAHITVLDQNTINKIAAGEVIERPASVVKELLENAIDARATAVTVEIRDGGISFIRVTDNGGGIAKEEVPTAFLRHSTSKISSAEDLFTVASLGFRGEALSSIAAVAQVELITKTSEQISGVRYQIEGGKERSMEEIGAPDGTTFLVRNLFYNTPVRQKFLKTAQTEGAHVAALVEKIAMSHPDISIRFIQNNQNKLHTSGNHNLKDIIYTVFGREIAANLLPVECEEEILQIRGFAGKPVIARSNRNFENYYINGRYVRSGLVAKAIEEAYRPYMMQHKYPFVLLHLTVEPEYLDVNVHPTKMELRFRDEERIYRMIYHAVSDALAEKELIVQVSLEEKEDLLRERREESQAPHPEPFEVKRRQEYEGKKKHEGWGEKQTVQEICRKPENQERDGGQQKVSGQPDASGEEQSGYGMRPIYGMIAESRNSWGEEARAAERKEREKTDNVRKAENQKPEGIKREEKPGSFGEQRITEKVDFLKELEQAEKKEEKPKQLDLFEEKLLEPGSRLRHKLIGQLFDTYWLVEFDNHLYIIDQHAAHEKVLYEKTMASLKTREFTSQIVSPPIILTLSSEEQILLEKYKNYFTEIGFEIESFGGRDYAVRAVPDNLFSIAKKDLLMEMLDNLSDDILKGSPDMIYEKVASMSCKAAVKGNHKMSDAEANHLIDQLLELENPYACPHGRPTIISMSKYELEKKFKRIV
ncbi:MAG: DNA mismatch repair endonuclease MutL [Hungatella sp.]|nr:DNA mismatch repair endonuclease MutL [Hungatella sp.]